jgi:hypothetical protein
MTSFSILILDIRKVTSWSSVSRVTTLILTAVSCDCL